jgi:hypothetical protein
MVVRAGWACFSDPRCFPLARRIAAESRTVLRYSTSRSIVSLSPTPWGGLCCQGVDGGRHSHHHPHPRRAGFARHRRLDVLRFVSEFVAAFRSRTEIPICYPGPRWQRPTRFFMDSGSKPSTAPADPIQPPEVARKRLPHNLWEVRILRSRLRVSERAAKIRRDTGERKGGKA